MQRNLDGKVALVTGGSRGIGAAIATRLAADGAAVAITSSAPSPKAQGVVAAIVDGGGRAVALVANNEDAAAIVDAVDATVRQFGRLDILVNNAGIAVFAPIDSFALADFDRTLAINVRAVFVASQAAARHLPRGGRIVTIGSVNAERMPLLGGSVYATSKAAVAGMTRGLARDLGPRGITVNCVQPGPIDTEMNPAEGPVADSFKAMLALPRYGTTEEIASMVAYLVREEAGYVTGACFTVDGGFLA